MAATVLAVAGVYLLGVKGMRSVPGAPAFRELQRGFAHTLIPIALAYLVAHYFSLFVYQEQAQFTYLLSDPLGHLDHRPLRHRRIRHRLQRPEPRTSSGTSRSRP